MTTNKYEDYQRYVDLLVKHSPEFVIGFDETGNGAIAGPLCVGACALPIDFTDKVKDSKRYSTDKARKKAYDLIASKAISYTTCMIIPAHIESMGHAEALECLYKEVLTFMHSQFGDAAIYILDGNKKAKYSTVPHSALVKADDFIPAVSAASIVAKFERDQILKDSKYTLWRFDKSKGYPTPEHLKMLNEFGPIRGFHRMNVKRVQKAFTKNGWYDEEDT